MMVQRTRIADSRGTFSRLFCADEFSAGGQPFEPVQINQSVTARRGTVRGMHYQNVPHADTKLVSCLKGEVFDVAVDLRANSPTFLQWHAENLSPENRKALLIPPGFAHGFQTLTDDCELIYLHSAAYRPDAEGAVSALDSRLRILWPIAVADMSDRDHSHPPIEGDYTGLAT